MQIPIYSPKPIQDCSKIPSEKQRIVYELIIIDEKRIYLSGHSMGAAGTMYLGAKHADIWAAIAPIDGGAKYGRPDILKPLKDAGVAVLIVQGDKDELVSVEDAKALAAVMKDVGVEHEYVEMPGISHGPSMTAGQKHVFEFFGKHSK